MISKVGNQDVYSRKNIEALCYSLTCLQINSTLQRQQIYFLLLYEQIGNHLYIINRIGICVTIVHSK